MMETVTFYKGPPPQPVTLHRGPLGPPWELPWTTFILHLTRYLHNYITWLFFFWIWRRRCLQFAWFWPFGALPLGPHRGHTYYLNNFESLPLRMIPAKFGLKSNHVFSRRRRKCKKFTDDARRTKTDGNSSGSGELKRKRERKKKKKERKKEKKKK